MKKKVWPNGKPRPTEDGPAQNADTINTMWSGGLFYCWTGTSMAGTTLRCWGTALRLIQDVICDHECEILGCQHSDVDWYGI